MLEEFVYLEKLLEEEFAGVSGVRLRKISGRNPGYVAKTKAREAVFFASWVREKKFDLIQSEIQKVKDGLHMLSVSNGGVLPNGRPDPYKDF
jgi:hypothetical protein